MTQQNIVNGIKYVIENTKYPEYIRNHAVFKNSRSIKKIFPSIGLPNIKEDVDYAGDPNEVKNTAIAILTSDILLALQPFRGAPNIGMIATSLYDSIRYNYPNMVTCEDSKWSIKFVTDIMSQDCKQIFIKNGESVFKGYNKFLELAKTFDLKIKSLDEMPNFKNFSVINVPGVKKYKLIFSSYDEEGLWDIATISMRGISSCQTWNTPQSHGLIGSMSSRYVGVIYLTSGAKFNEYGSKMLRRALVRFCINTNTNKPALLVDRIYPSEEASAKKLFADFLKEKTKLPVVFATDGTGEWGKHRLPLETQSWIKSPLQETEKTYMDTKIPWMVKPIIASSLTFENVANDLAILDNNLDKNVMNVVHKLSHEYLSSENKKMHHKEFSGGVVNLLSSLEKHVGKQFIPALTPRIYNIGYSPTSYSHNSQRDKKLPDIKMFNDVSTYKKAIIRSLILNGSYIRNITESNLKRYKQINKSFPKSIEKLANIICIIYKQELLAVYKTINQN